MIEEFEEEYDHMDESSVKRHHECGKTFQTDFFNDVERLYKSFSSNPFELHKLTVISDVSQVFEDNIFHNISKLEQQEARSSIRLSTIDLLLLRHP